jgi:hypothetical protein
MLKQKNASLEEELQGYKDHHSQSKNIKTVSGGVKSGKNEWKF